MKATLKKLGMEISIVSVEHIDLKFLVQLAPYLVSLLQIYLLYYSYYTKENKSIYKYNGFSRIHVLCKMV